MFQIASGGILRAALAAELLFAGFILGRYADDAVPAYYVLRPIVVATLLALVLGAASWLLFRGAAPLVAVIASALVAFWSLFAPWGLLVILVGGLLALAVWFVKLRGERAVPIARGLSGVALSVVAIFFAIGLARAVGAALDAVTPEVAVGAQAPEGPNLYLLLLDGYPRPDSLRNEFGIDVEPFTRDLDARGFTVYSDAETDRIWTDVTLLALLEGTTEDIPIDVAEPADRRALRDRLARAALPQRLQQAGYEWIVIDSPAGHVTFNGGRHIQHGGLNNYEERLLRESLLGAVVAAWWPSMPTDSLRNHLGSSLESLISLADRETRHVVLAHIFAPHLPVLWDSAGAPAPAPSFWPRVQLFESQRHITGLSVAEYSSGLESHIAMLNARLMETIDAILARDADAVIVLFGDHGARYDTTQMETEWRRALLAGRVPGFPDLFADDPSPTTILRALLDAYVPLSEHGLVEGGRDRLSH